MPCTNVLYINTLGGWFDWFVPLLAYKLLSCFSPLPCSLLRPNRNAPLSNLCQRISHTVGCIPANKPLIASCFLRTLTVFYSPAWNTQSSKFWQQISLPVLVGAGRLLIVRSMNNITGPTDARTGSGYKLNCTRRGLVGGARDFASVL